MLSSEIARSLFEFARLVFGSEYENKIDPFNRAAPEVLALRIEIYRGLEKWELIQEITKRLAEFQPDNVEWTISLAYATRRTDSIQTAKEVLLNAEPKFPKEPAIKYNLACYFCQTGDIQSAKRYFELTNDGVR